MRILRFLFVALALLVLLPNRAFADNPNEQVLIDEVRGAYRVVATLAPNPPAVGEALLRVVITDATSGQPSPLNLVQLYAAPDSIGREELFTMLPENQDRNAGRYTSDRLRFTISDQWTMRLVLGAPEGEMVFTTKVQVDSVFKEIGEAAVIAVPATLVGLAVVFIGYKIWRKKRQAAN
ncbi:MAG TPA: hypothetical protein DEF47_13670 [Herpetosiphon sp.]|uniref:YtkA-like domain-containing protein n=1 Tax=Herpetosiphon aurantiacus (strain ATCC 23779 / DSM 785 / 114-95) TaxID=316274 RepID=A9B7J0_HERA2|nr:hypothetical protein [Herpetosiphon sp.]ABX02963.1 hypothetical protein Haur_0311 [Herpetosiphon aurantiacus DSM 785]HBW50937.1 hypothetical protein [Herpetosiphon sp.]